MKSVFYCIVIITFTLCLAGFSAKEYVTEDCPEIEIEFIDDCGNPVIFEKPAKRIISLYSAHTENLFALGLHKEIIGVGKTDNYPPKVKEKKVFDYRSDPEKVIAANPDLVLIRPFVKKSSPEFIHALENANINVVCLYPEKFEDFVPYIKQLALLTGKDEYAEELISNFQSVIEQIRQTTLKINPKVKVYFESTEKNYRTITEDSMPATAILFAGGINTADDAAALHKGTSIASYGAEKLLEKAGEIDVYIAQRGKMNPSVTTSSIIKRPGFYVIKAVKEGRVYCIDEKLVSSPTFRFAVGVQELARMFYPELFVDEPDN